VGALSKIGTQVHTVNFAPAGTQDLIFGRAIAERLGTAHTEVALGEDTAENKRSLAIAACLDSARARAAPPERSRLVWAGDGGSVGLGHVYLSSGPISLIREGHLEQAVDAFQKHHNVSLPRFILNRDAADTLSGILKQSILAEVSAFSGSDPGRALHLFLMQNDQRRHLAQHFENIDLDRVEMHLPFFDAEFLAPVLASPVDHFLRHRFYNEWLAHFPDPISQVPWQAYPGHEPCPLTVNEILRYQWTDYYDAQSKKKIVSKVLENATVMLRSDTFPHVFVSKVRLRLAALLMRLGIRDTRISVLVAYSYFCYWIKCNSTTDSRTVSQVQQ
jgi:hypothetical protein